MRPAAPVLSPRAPTRTSVAPTPASGEQNGLQHSGIQHRVRVARSGARRLLRSTTADRLRAGFDGLIDSIRLRIDRLGLRAYQPLPGKAATARRALGTRSRWTVMRSMIDAVGPSSALDVGCNAGWYVVQLAAAGIPTVGIESDPPMYRTAIVAVRRAAVNAGVLVLRVEPGTLDLIPRTDCILFLSVWHHMVRDMGLAAADAILAGLWERAGKMMFFETGEAECVESFGLPAMEPDPHDWVRDHLGAVCGGATVRNLGMHPAFGPDGAACKRNLWVLLR